jgi:putative PIN family toxin of toxin-antitoxin system
MRRLRVVLDTNVFVSGLINPDGAPGAVLKALRDQKFVLVSSEPVNLEIMEVLSRPGIQEKYGLKDYLYDIALILWEKAELAVQLPEVKISKDPDDNKFIATAIAGSAHLLVTGDAADLLPIKSYENIHIVTPAEFLALLRTSTTQ